MLTCRCGRNLVAIGLGLAFALGAGRGLATAQVREGGESIGVAGAIVEALERGPLQRSAERQLTAAEIGHERASAAFGVRVTPTATGGFESLGLIQQTVGVGVGKRLASGGELAVSAATFRYGGALGDARDTTAAFRVTQPLWSAIGRVATTERDNARAELSRSRERLADRGADVVLIVFTRYAEALRQNRALAAARRANDRASLLVASSHARKAAGLATDLDVMRAELFAYDTASAIERHEEHALSAFDELRRVLGRPMGSSLELLDDEARLEEMVARVTGGTNVEAVDGLVARALDRRSDLVDARLRVTMARRSADVARWQELPPVSIEAGYTRFGVFGFGAIARPSNGGWHVGIVTGGGAGIRSARAARRAAELQIAAAEEDATELADRVALEVRAAARAATRSARAVSAEKARLALVLRQRELVEIREARGLATSLDRADAEAAVFDVETAVVSARLDHVVSLLTLERAVGGLSPRSITP